MKGLTSKLIHGNLNENPYGALRTPIYQNSAFEFENSQKISDAFMGKLIAPAYSRTANPTLIDLEQKISLLTGAPNTLVVASGMAALANTFITLMESGDNIITTPCLFANTYSFFEDTFKCWGLNVKYPDFNRLDLIESAIDSRTRAIYLETISNPQMAVFDIEAISKIAEKHEILLILDNTAATSYLFDAKKYGVHIEIISTTKFISTGAASVGGAIIDYANYSWNKIPKMKSFFDKFGQNAFIKKLRSEVFRNLGACLSPENAYLQSLGIETMPLRIDRSCSNALTTAQFLSESKIVKKVNYPGLKTSPYYPNASKLFKDKFGGILTFELENESKCFQFMDSLKMIRRATNLNDNKSLIIHPSSTIYSEFTESIKNLLEVNTRLIRLSIGIEDPEDILDDLQNAILSIK